MKICGACKVEKPLEAFNKNKGKKDGHASVCRECQKVYKDAHYRANKAKVYAKVVQRRQELTDKVWEYKNNSKCDDCGERNPIVLEFDHLRDKEFSIGSMANAGYSWNKIREEIQKCDVVCANCHRIRTHIRGGWVRNIVTPCA